MDLLSGPSPALTAYLRLRGWIARDASVVSLEPAGEGNMNLVRRARLDDGDALILKHARPWVEKYPAIAAPAGRTLVEGAFYGQVNDWPAVAGRMPRFIGLDRTDRLLALENCAGEDLTSLYGGAVPTSAMVEALAGYLLSLHGIPIDVRDHAELLNPEMRTLNHAHMFDIPLQANNGVDLEAICPGLASAATAARADRAFVEAVQALGRVYLDANGPALAHGDFFPGSWLQTPRGLVVIDPEFCFLGPPEFDLGVCAAHFRLAGLPAQTCRDLLTHYRRGTSIDVGQVSAWAGVEIMRRLLGVAQLPLVATIGQRRALLDEARALVSGATQLEAA